MKLFILSRDSSQQLGVAFSVLRLLKAKEKLKSDSYDQFLRSFTEQHLRQVSASSNPFDLFGISFVPAVMSIYGNIGPAFDDTLRTLAAMPTRGFNPDLHPVRDSFFLTEQQSNQATYRRLRCLVATAHARALANSFSLATVFRRPGRREETLSARGNGDGAEEGQGRGGREGIGSGRGERGSGRGGRGGRGIGRRGRGCG